MRIPSGVTDQYVYFVAVDATDLKTRETGLASFTVYRSRNGGAAAAMTTPTINETDATNMPGVYELLLDEDMTIDSGDDTQEMVFHITHAGMAPVTRTIELYRAKATIGETLSVASGNVTVSLNLDKTAYYMAGTKTTLDALNDISTAQVNTECDNALVTYGLDHLVSAAVVGTDVVDNSIIAKLASKSATADWDTYDNTSDSYEAIRDRGDAAWITGGGGSITQMLNVQPVIPSSIDLANTATVRLGLILLNALDDLPSTAEITPGTISIERKAYGGTSWTAVVTDAAMSEQAGMVYYDEVFDTGTGYALNDSLRITFKSVSITADANTFEVVGASGIMFQTSIRQQYPANMKDLVVSLGTGLVSVGSNFDKTGYLIDGTKNTLDDLNDLSAAQVNTEVDTALADIHLDHLLAVDYDPASKPGVATALFNELIESDAGVSRYTANALEQAPSGGGGTADWTADERTAIRAILGIPGTGTTPADPTTGILDTIRDAVGVVDGVVDTILIDTNELQTDWANGGRLDNILDARSSQSSVNALPSSSAIADAVWDEAISGHLSAGTTGNALNAAGSSGDPWSTPLPGAYGAGTAGKIIGDNINAPLNTIDTVVDAIKAKTDSLTFTDAGKVDATLQAAADVKAAVANKVADHALRRNLGTALASSDGDTKTFRSLAGATAKMVNKVALNSTTLTVYEADDSTSLGTQTVTTSSSASPITAMDTD